MFRYWRHTLDGLVGLACDAFEVPIVLAGEWMLRRWDKQHPQAHDIDMADALADVEAEQEVWEPENVIYDNDLHRELSIDIIQDVLSKQGYDLAATIYDALFGNTQDTQEK